MATLCQTFNIHKKHPVNSGKNISLSQESQGKVYLFQVCFWDNSGKTQWILFWKSCTYPEIVKKCGRKGNDFNSRSQFSQNILTVLIFTTSYLVLDFTCFMYATIIVNRHEITNKCS